jgi:hypothetical protein
MGYDPRTQLVMAQAGYLQDQMYLEDKELVNTRPHKWVANERFRDYVQFTYTSSDSKCSGFIGIGEDNGFGPGPFMPDEDPEPKQGVPAKLVSMGWDLEEHINRWVFDAKLQEVSNFSRNPLSCGPLSLLTRATRNTYAIYGHHVYFKRYEDFYDHNYHWIGKWHDITDRRMQYSWQWNHAAGGCLWHAAVVLHPHRHSHGRVRRAGPAVAFGNGRSDADRAHHGTHRAESGKASHRPSSPTSRSARVTASRCSPAATCR